MSGFNLEEKSFMGTEMLLGKNLHQAINMKFYLAERKNTTMMFPYWYTLEKQTRTLKSCKDKIKNCCVCGSELHELKILDKFNMSSNPENNTMVTQKKHAMYIDIYGVKHYTCYGINNCFKKINYTPYLNRSEAVMTTDEFKAPALQELVDLQLDSDMGRQILKSMKEDYQNNIAPFIEKWKGTETARNVAEYITDYSRVRLFLNYFDDIAKDVVAVKIKSLLK